VRACAERGPVLLSREPTDLIADELPVPEQKKGRSLPKGKKPWHEHGSRPPAALVGDDTVDGHQDKQVHGKARRRDPVRTAKSYAAWRYGHRWAVLAVLVRFPFATRPWALPVPADLNRSAEDDARRRRPHRTPAPRMCRLSSAPKGWPRQFKQSVQDLPAPNP
jgi:hypothetical protein